MSVRGVGRGGKAGGAKGASGAGGAAKASATSFGAKVDKAESLVGPSGAAGSSNVGQVGPTDPVTAQAMELVRQLRTGQLASREEASKKLIADILREKINNQSKKLTDRIFEQLKEDPRFNQMFERLWDRAQEQE